MGGGRSNTTQSPDVPEYLRPLMIQSAELLASNQQQMPLSRYMNLPYQQVSGLTSLEDAAIRNITNQAQTRGPTLQENYATLYGNNAMNRANQRLTPINSMENLSVSGYNQLVNTAGQDIMAPKTDAQMLSALGGAANISRQMGDFSKVSRQESKSDKAIGAAQKLGRTDLGYVSGLENDAVSNLRAADTAGTRTLAVRSGLEDRSLANMDQFNRLGQTQLGTLTGSENQAIQNLNQLAQIGQTDTPRLQMEELQALDRLGGFGQLNQTQLATQYEPEQAARNVLQQFIGGELGSSPATQAAMAVFNTQTMPQIQSQLALRGLSNSGAAAEAIAQANQSAYVPLVQQELLQRQQAVPMLQQLGATYGAREREDLGRQMQGELALSDRYAQLGGVAGAREEQDLQRAMMGLSDSASQLRGIGQVEGAREREDLGRQMAAMQATAQHQANLGNLEQQRMREDTDRRVATLMGTAAQRAGIGATQEQRRRDDLNRQINTELSVSQRWQDLGNQLKQRELQANQQQFAQQMGLGSAYQDASNMFYGREASELDRLLGAQSQRAGALMGLGATMGQREAMDRDAAVNAMMQNAGMQAQMGNTIANRDFNEMMQSLAPAGMQRQINDQRLANMREEQLRQAAMAEQLLLAPISSGVLTSGIGQQVSGRQSGMLPGMYKPG